MKHEDKKAVIAAYKERKVDAGIFALRCGPSAQVWVGYAPDLPARENRIRFSLRMGTYPMPGVQAALTRHGQDAFSFDVLERLDPETPEALRSHRLAARAEHWCTTLGADPA